MLLRRVILIVAIIAAIAAVGINIGVVRPKIQQLRDDRDSQRNQKDEYHHELDQTKRTLSLTQAQLTQTQNDLTQAQAARDQLSSKLDAANTQIQDLNDKITKVTTQLHSTSDQLAAYTGTGLTPPQVVALNKQLADTQMALSVANQEKVVLGREVAKLNNQIQLLIGTNYVVRLPASLKGTVMAVDPKWNFVVLNVGENQGVLPQGELLVSRDGRLVGKVVISSVQKDRSIANLVPGWQLGDIIEGDQVIPANPAS